MTLVEAARLWLRDSGLIDGQNRFNAGYLGARATQYSITTASDTYVQDILGRGMRTSSLLFSARLPFGEALEANLSATDFFSALAEWIRAQERRHNYPNVDGYTVTAVQASNAGMILRADANTAVYQIQVQFHLEEV